MSTTTTVKSWVKQFIAVVKGDDAEVTAQKVFRQADSALKTQINSLEGDSIVFEDAVTEAKEKLALARLNNGKTIADRNQYVQNLLNAKNAVTEAEEALENHKVKIEFLKEEQKNLSAEEDEGTSSNL